MRYQLSLEIFVNDYGFFLTFAKNIGKSLSGKYSKKLLDSATCAAKVAKQSAADVLKTASKREIQKKAEALGDLIDNKITDKILKVSKTSPKSV